MSRLLIYKQDRPLKEERIIISNPNFDSGLSGWQAGPGWTGVTDTAALSITSGFTQISTQFLSLPSSLATYNVSFSYISDASFDVYIGNEIAQTISAGGGNFTFTWQCPEYDLSSQNIPNFILFAAEGPINLVLDSISIERNLEISPLYDNESWIEHGYLDCDVEIPLSFKREDLSTVGKRNGVSTKNFKIPGTDNNNQLLSFWFVDGASTFEYDIKKKIKAKLISEEGGVVIDGWLAIDSIDRERDNISYNVVLTTNAVRNLEIFSNSKLRELDLSRYDHFLFYDVVSDTWTAAADWQSGYVYPFWFRDANEPYIIGEDFHPAMYDRMIFDEIHRYHGVSYELSPNMESWMNYAVTTASGRKPNVNQNAIELTRIEANTTSSSNQASGVQQNSSSGIFFMSVFNYENEIVWDNEVFDLYERFFINDSIFKPLQTGKYNVTFTVAGDINFTFPNPVQATSYQGAFLLYLEFVDLSDMSVTGLVKLAELFTATSNHVFTNTYQLEGITLQSNKQYAVKIRVVNENSFYDLSAQNYIRPAFDLAFDSIDMQIQLDPTNQINEGSLVQLNQFLPDVSHADFINDKITQFNALVVQGQDGKLLYTTEDEYYSPLKEVFNMSGKIDMDDVVNIQHLSRVAPVQTRFSYLKANDLHNSNYINYTRGNEYGSKLFLSSNDTHSNISEVRLKVYEPTPIVSNNMGDIFPAVYTKEYPQKPRNLFTSVNPVALGGDRIKVKYVNESGVFDTVEIEERKTFLHIDNISNSQKDLNFGEVETVFASTTLDLTTNNLFNTFWQTKMNLYKESKIYTVTAILTINDVIELLNDTGRRIWIEEFGRYFIIQSINDYVINDSGVAAVELELLEYLAINPIQGIIKSVPATNVQLPSVFVVGGTNITNIIINDSNEVTGFDNVIIGTGNTVQGNGNIVMGNNTYIDASFTNVFVYGSTGYTATTSNIANYYDTTIITPTGLTTNNIYATTISGDTIYAGSAITIGNTTITEQSLISGLTAQDLQSVLDTGNTAFEQDIYLYGSSSGGTEIGGNIVAGVDSVFSTNVSSAIFSSKSSTLNNNSYTTILSSKDSTLQNSINSSLLDSELSTLDTNYWTSVFATTNSTIQLNLLCSSIGNDALTFDSSSSSVVLGGSGTQVVSGVFNSIIAGNLSPNVSSAGNSAVIGSQNSTMSVVNQGFISSSKDVTVDDSSTNASIISSFNSSLSRGQNSSVIASSSAELADEATGFASIVNSAAIEGSNIFVVGNFTQYNGQSVVPNFAKLTNGLAIVTAFSCSTNSDISTIAFDVNSNAWIGGQFTTINGATYNRIGVVDKTTGSIVPSFSGYSTGFNGIVRKIRRTHDDKMMVVGNFTQYNGVTYNRIVKLNLDGTVDSSFSADVNGLINDVIIDSSGNTFIGGSFSTVNSTTVYNVAKLSSGGTLDVAFLPTVNNVVTSLCLNDTEDKIYIGGSFTDVNSTTVGSICQLNISDGQIADSLGAGGTGAVNSIINAYGRITIGGNFTTFSGQNYSRLVSLSSSANTIDSTFDVGSGILGGQVLDIVPQSINRYIVVGSFTSYNGFQRRAFVRLQASGDLTSVQNSALISGRNSTIAQSLNSSILSGEENEIRGAINSSIIASKSSYIDVEAQNSVILGGDLNQVNDNISNSVVLGGNSIIADKDNTAFAQRVNIKEILILEPISSGSITDPENGMVVYDSVSGLTIYHGGTWRQISLV